LDVLVLVLVTSSIRDHFFCSHFVLVATTLEYKKTYRPEVGQVLLV
jgi:hypothetical protein